MTEHDIIQALGVHLYLKYICIPNVLMLGDNCTEYEADFIYFKHNQRFLTEVEVKTNIEDFKRDFNKKRYHDHNEPWKHACFAKFHKTGVKVYSNGTNSYTSPDNKKEFYQYYKSTR